jgi:hypothetical protein
MKLLFAICSMLLVTNAATLFDTIYNPYHDQLTREVLDPPGKDPEKIEDINVYEIEEEVFIGFDTKKYLPKGFNSLEGLYDLDWNKIELTELEEEIEIDFDTKQHLPKGFNPLKGMYDLDWSKIELIEIEEEVEINFNTLLFLPDNFDPCKGI